MKAPLGRAGVRLLTGVLGTLAAGILFAPAPARADCGDYVMIGNPAGHGTATTHTPTPDSARPGPAPHDGRKPCSGPRCSGGVPAAPAPVSPPTSPRGEDSCLAAVAADPSVQSPATCWRDDSRPRPIRQSSVIYHPPR